MIEYSGSCHCTGIQLRYQTALAPAAWPVRACQCSFCRMHMAETTSDPAGSLCFSAPKLDTLERYRFDTRSADFLICRRCGVYLGAVVEVQGARIGVINLHVLRPAPLGLLPPSAANYDGESSIDRRARRAARWTPLAPESL